MRAIRVTVTLAILALWSTACAAVAPSTPSGGERTGGRVIIGSISDAKVLNPILLTELNSGAVTEQIYESLIALNKDTGLPEPRLAERFEQSPDSRTLTFVLRDGLQWSDGSPFSGEDFRFTAEAIMRSKKAIWKNRFQDIAGAREFADGAADSISGINIAGTVSLQGVGTKRSPHAGPE